MSRLIIAAVVLGGVAIAGLVALCRPPALRLDQTEAEYLSSCSRSALSGPVYAREAAARIPIPRSRFGRATLGTSCSGTPKC